VRGAVALNFLKLVALTTIVAGAWAAVGWLLEGFSGLVLFLFASLLIAAAVVWHAERMLLAILHAREVPVAELPHVHSALERVAARARVPKPRLYVIEDGHLRSLSAGTGPRRSGVAMTRGLLGAVQPEELDGLLAHEVAHIRRRDVAVQTVVAILTFTILELSRVGWRAQGALLYALGPIAASFTNAFVAPKRELRADSYAATLAGSPHGLADALLRLELAGELVLFAENPATEPLYVVNPFGDDRLAVLFDTHPPIGERVQALRALDPEFSLSALEA
jgi:heat shock protein HtpX